MPNNEWGDFQTPLELAQQVVELMHGAPWSRVLEPTCGTGTFLDAAQALASDEYIGIEVNEEYANESKRIHPRIIIANIFDFDLTKDLNWKTSGPLLVIGNPPWVTNADLTCYGSINIPEKVNLRDLSGFDAMTGASNFDIAEYIWLKLVMELINEEPVIALLCKTHVARNVLTYCHELRIPIQRAELRRFDAKKWFGVGVDACLFVLDVGGSDPLSECAVYESMEAVAPDRYLGFANDQLVADIEAYELSRFADAKCALEWRQGIKHDAARVMQLNVENGQLINGLGQIVDVEEDWVYPLMKATDVFRGRPPQRRVIVTQRRLSDDTGLLRNEAPELWRYLCTHGDILDRRRSSIYRGRPRFAMFGVGEYTFAPWKIMISGLHKEPVFRVVGPHDGRPVLGDDTTYFLPLESKEEADAVSTLLRSETATYLLEALTFPDSKRPVTKKLLQRIDLVALAGGYGDENLVKMLQRLSASTR